MSKKSNHTKRATSLKAAAAELGISFTTIRNWARRDDAPFTRTATGRIRCNPDELRQWAATTDLTGKLGRPRKESDEGAKWLARIRRAQALKLEGATIDRAEHIRIVTQLAQVAVAKLRTLPAAAAPATIGKSAAEVEGLLQCFVDDICDYLADPANYELVTTPDELPAE